MTFDRENQTTIDSIAQKAYVIDKIAQRAVDAPEGGRLVQKGEIIDLRIANAAEHLHILDELYRCCQPTTESTMDEINVQSKTSILA
jgi:hypothetical protein